MKSILYFTLVITFVMSGSAFAYLNRACEKKSVKTVFYDYIFTYPAL